MDRHDEMLKVELFLSCRALGQTLIAFDLYQKKNHTSSFCLIIVFSPLCKDRMIV